MDAIFIEKEEEAMNQAWRQLECGRGVFVARARAANALSVETRMSRDDALDQARADPKWIAAEEECKQGIAPTVE